MTTGEVTAILRVVLASHSCSDEFAHVYPALTRSTCMKAGPNPDKRWPLSSFKRSVRADAADVCSMTDDEDRRKTLRKLSAMLECVRGRVVR